MLSGAWEKDTPDIDEEAFCRFWENILQTESRLDLRSVEPVRPVQWPLVDPVTDTEVNKSLKAMDSGTAPGPDSRDLKTIKDIPIA